MTTPIHITYTLWSIYNNCATVYIICMGGWSDWGINISRFSLVIILAFLKAQRGSTVITITCPQWNLDYNCSFLAASGQLNLTWQITFPNENPVTISLDENSFVGIYMDAGGLGQVALTRHVRSSRNSDSYIESILALSQPSSRKPLVQCTVNSMPTTDLVVPIYQGNVRFCWV